MSDITKFAARTARTALAALAVGALAACGSDKAPTGPAAASTSSVTDPEHVIVSDAAAAKGLAETVAKMTTLAADPPAAADGEAVEALWASYEGTVKKNDTQAYLDFEDELGSYRDAAKAGDAAAMRKALASFSATSTTYLQKHPG